MNAPFEPGSDSAARMPCPQCSKKFVTHASMFQHQKAAHGVSMPRDEIGKAAALFDILIDARRYGKDWWADAQLKSIEIAVQQDRRIAKLVHALEMVRDADEDCKRDGEGGALPIPPFARATVDAALAGAA